MPSPVRQRLRRFDPDDVHRRIRAPRSDARRPVRAALVAGLFLAIASACTPIGDPDLGTGTEISTDTAVETDAGADEPVIQAPDDESADVAPSPVAAVPVFSPPRPEGYIPSLLIVAQEEVSVRDSTAIGFADQAPLDLVLDGGAETVVDDFFGGLVVGLNNEETGRSIVWLRADDSAPAPIVTGDERLLDVGFIDSTLQAHALVASSPQLIERVPLGEGERAILVQLSEPQSLIDLSASEGLHALSIADANCGAVLFFDSSGEEVAIGGPGVPPCAVGRRPAYGAIALSPDAARIAFTLRTYRSDGVVATTELVVQELGTDVVVFSQQIGGPGENVDNLTYDGSRLVFTREGPELIEVIQLESTADAEEQLVSISAEPSSVVFARQPITVGR